MSSIRSISATAFNFGIGANGRFPKSTFRKVRLFSKHRREAICAVKICPGLKNEIGFFCISNSLIQRSCVVIVLYIRPAVRMSFHWRGLPIRGCISTLHLSSYPVLDVAYGQLLSIKVDSLVYSLIVTSKRDEAIYRSKHRA